LECKVPNLPLLPVLFRKSVVGLLLNSAFELKKSATVYKPTLFLLIPLKFQLVFVNLFGLYIVQEFYKFTNVLGHLERYDQFVLLGKSW